MENELSNQAFSNEQTLIKAEQEVNRVARALAKESVRKNHADEE